MSFLEFLRKNGNNFKKINLKHRNIKLDIDDEYDIDVHIVCNDINDENNKVNIFFNLKNSGLLKKISSLEEIYNTEETYNFYFSLNSYKEAYNVLNFFKIINQNLFGFCNKDLYDISFETEDNLYFESFKNLKNKTYINTHEFYVVLNEKIFLIPHLNNSKKIENYIYLFSNLEDKDNFLKSSISMKMDKILNINKISVR